MSTDLAELPNWPALLSRDQLRAYLGGVGEDTLLKVCPVAPVDFGANLIRYSRAQIDAWIGGLPPRQPKPTLDVVPVQRDEPPPEAFADPAERAIERAQARARAKGKGGRWRKTG